MPINHRTNFEKKKCPDTAEARRRIPGCALPQDKPFDPQSRHPPKPKPKPDIPVFPIPDKPDIPVFPIPGKPDVPVFPIPDKPDDPIRVRVSPAAMKTFLDEFKNLYEKENPILTPEDRVAAEMAAGSYIHNYEQLNIYVNEVSHIGAAGYTIDKELTDMSDGLIVVYERNGKATYSFRGTEEWIGPDGLANLTNPTGFNLFSQALRKSTGVDLRPDQQKTIEKTLEAGVKKYGTPEAYNGHSRGGAEAKIARLRYGGGTATVFDTSPGGRAVQQNEGVREWASETDVVSALDRAKLAATGRGDSNVVRSTTGYDPLGSHDINTFIPEEFRVEHAKLILMNKYPENLRNDIIESLQSSDDSFTSFMKKQGITNISLVNNDDPIKNMWQEEYNKLYSGDSFERYRNQFPAFSDSETKAILAERTVTLNGKTFTLPKAISSQSEINKLSLSPLELNKPVFTNKLHTVAGLVKDTGLGIATSVASNAITSALDPNATGQKKLLETAGTNILLDSTVAGTGAAITGAPVLAAAGSAFAELAAPTVVAYEVANSVGKAMDNATKDWKNRDAARATSGAVTGASAAASGVATYGSLNAAINGVRILRAGAAANEAAAADSVVAGGIEMTAVGTGATDISAAAAGAVTTAGEGIEMAAIGTEVAETAAATTGLAATEEIAGGIALLPVPGARPVAAIIALGALVGIGFANLFHHTDSPEEKERKRAAAQKQLEDKYKSISKRYIDAQQANKLDIKLSSFSPLKPEDVLTDDEIKFMTSHQPKYFDTVNSALKNVWEHERNKYKMNEMNVAEQKSKRKDVADSYDEVRHRAEKESFYSTDEMTFANAVDEWTPDQSTILRAHQQNLTLGAFNRYMTALSANSGDAEKAKSFVKHFINENINEDDNISDINHFRSDLVYAGYKPDAYTYQKDPSGVYKFVRNEKVELERDPTQIAEVAALRATQGDAFVQNLIQSGHLSLKEKLNSATQKLLFTQNEIHGKFDRNAGQAFSWRDYESYRPDVHTFEYEVPTQLNASAHNLIKYEKEKLAAQKFGMTREIYEQTKQYIQDNNIKVKTKQDVISAETNLRNENLKRLNPGMSSKTQFSNNELNQLESGGEVTNKTNHSVYAAA